MTTTLICVIDDDAAVRKSVRAVLESAGFRVREFESARSFLTLCPERSACLITDVRMPEMDGLELLAEINKLGINLPVIVMTGHGDVPLAVRAIQAGAANFIEKPFDGETMLGSVRKALDMDRGPREKIAQTKAAQKTLALLTPGEHRVLAQVAAGRSNKIAAHALGLSSRTIENHRRHIMLKLRAHSVADLMRIVLAAA